MNRLFNTAPISGLTWAIIIGLALTIFLIVGLEKWLRFRAHGPQASQQRTSNQAS
jgi:hypothetical protein